jgi:hypothetical protein
VTANFLYPESTRFAFDETCQLIIRALKARNWIAPKVWVDFAEYKLGHTAQSQTVHYVKMIWGSSFCLRFGRSIDERVRFYQEGITDVSEICILSNSLMIHHDSSLVLYKYTQGPEEWRRGSILCIGGSSARPTTSFANLPGSCVRYIAADQNFVYDPKWGMAQNDAMKDTASGPYRIGRVVAVLDSWLRLNVLPLVRE